MMEGLTNIFLGSSRQNVVKIRPLTNKKIYLQICIGSSIARELEWMDGDSLHVELDSTKNIVLLKNINNMNSEHWPIKGYVFRKINKSYSYSVNLPSDFLDAENIKNKVVEHEIIKEKGNKFLKVYLSGRKEHRNIGEKIYLTKSKLKRK